MGNGDPTRVGKQLAWLLRHGAGEAGVRMDAAGWVDVEEVLRASRLTRADLEAVVATNTKSRLELRGDRVRACQGHSLAGVPVTLEALEASWAPHVGDAVVWHGTSMSALEGIAREGILPIQRTHVHLAEALDSRAGKRAGVDVMLAVSPQRLRAAGLGLFRSPNGVLLARHVPTACVVGLRPMTERARRRRAELAAVLGVADVPGDVDP
jgi:putative RNA 2'-phosphotransferase